MTLTLLTWGVGLQAQEANPIKDIVEGLAENLGEEYDLSELTERLEYYLQHPIDLNKASALQLNELLFLSPLQIGNLLSHISTEGKLTDILELQSIDGFDIQTINRLSPFIAITPPLNIDKISSEQLYGKGTNDLILRYGRILEQQKGFGDLPGSRYLGTPDKVLIRYRYTYASVLSASLVLEKDAGEYWLKKKTGADHLSFNLVLNDVGRLKKLILGDYSLQFGQGLTLWSGFAYGKGPDVTSVAAKDLGLRPYNSSNEASFFRGLAGTIRLSKYFQLTPFISLRKLDASLKNDTDDNPSLQNISISGLHRTPTELKNQKSLGQLIYGGSINYVSDNLNFGFISYQSQYQHPFVTGTRLYNRYGFTGKRLTNSGIHYNYTYKNIYFYGETASSLDGGWAILHGALASLSPKFSAVLLHRNYDRNYHNFLSNGVGEATEISNEKGLYLGLNYAPLKKWTLSVYGDYFRFPWLKYLVDAPSSGYEALTQITYLPSKTFKASLRYKREVKQQNSDADNAYDPLDRVNKQGLRMDWNWQAKKKLGFHQRIEMSGYQKGRGPDIENVSEVGYMFLQDVDFKPAGRLSGNVRFAYFNTPAYDTRIYAYEDNVLYGASSGVYYGKGIRIYINTRCRLIKGLDCWARYAISTYFNRETVGSGLDEIDGNSKTDIKIQIRYQF
jgi:hypothetical protein